MIRVKIAGEEVVSSNDIVITEELLKTSSTILDNVYPKEWEITHDYVNNFYFPKDYSSCNIENVEPIEPIIGTRTSGNNINLNYNNELSFEIEQLKGNTEQNGTPTPSSPIPVNNVTGRQEIDVVGKNLFDDTIVQGVVGSTGVNDTPNRIRNTKFINVIPGQTYSLSFETTNGINQYNISYFTNASFPRTSETGWINTSFTIPSGINYIMMSLSKSSGQNIVPTDISNVQLEKGTTATTYERYIGKQYEINLGKNLCNITSEQCLHYSSGLPTDSSATIVVDNFDNNNVSFHTTSANYNIVLSNIIQLQSNTTYTIKFDRTTTSTNNQWFIYDYNGSYSINFRDNNTNVLEKTFTTNNVGKIALAFGHGNTTGQTEITNIQIEKGNQPSSYSPYKTPIELCKIGNYQDYLFKINNKWYLHKEIGKLILTGGDDEDWSVYGLSFILNFNHTQFRCFCDKFASTTNQTWVSSDTSYRGKISTYNSPTQIKLMPTDTSITTVAQWRTWLSTHNTEVYYVLENSTDTEITDTELINQIKSIELYNGINNISTLSPNANGELQIYYNYRNAGEDIELIFAGLIKNSGSISLRPTDPKYCSLQILDYKTLLSEGQTLDYVINNKTIKEAIQMVINSVASYGFIEGNINIDAANDVIGAYSTLNKTPYDVFQYLADISQSKWFTRVIDDKTIAIDFYDPDKLPKADDIEYTEEYFKGNNIIDINFSFSSSDYRNKQAILSEKVYGNVATNDIITCNGYEQTFTTSQTIGTINSIKVNNVEKTYATNTEKGLGILADFYYSPNSNSIESEELYNAGDKIIISYMPLIKGRRVISNDNEISRINQQINRNGIISRYEERNDIVDGDELSKVAEAYIKYKGTAEIKLNVQTENKDLFDIGQQVYFDMPNLEDLATDYMVKKKEIEIIQTGEYRNIFYIYELTSNFNSETDINFFDNQRRKAEGNISEDQFITRNVDINNTANIIFDNLQMEEVQTTDNNTLNCALNSPFIN